MLKRGAELRKRGGATSLSVSVCFLGVHFPHNRKTKLDMHATKMLLKNMRAASAAVRHIASPRSAAASSALLGRRSLHASRGSSFLFRSPTDVQKVTSENDALESR